MIDRSYGLDLVRALCIWMVMAAHVAYWFYPAANGFYAVYITPLMLGVEPFFVLGGYLAAYSFKKFANSRDSYFALSDAFDYLKRRWLRTLPNYFLFLAIYTLAFSLIKSDFEFSWSYLIFTQNFYWLAPNFFSVSWSLATQEWFYFMLPAFMLLSALLLRRWFGFNNMLASSIVMILIAFVARYIYIESVSIINLEGDLRRIALLRIDSVAIGVLIGWFYLNYRDLYIQKSNFIALVSVLSVVALAYLRRQDWFSGCWIVQMCYYPFFSLALGLLIPAFHSISISSLGWWRKLIVNTSKWSYSIYLSHVLFLDTIVVICEKVKLPLMGAAITPFFVVVWVVVVYIAAALLYKYFERPFMDLYKKRQKGKVVATAR